jgi:hypothetical protein
MTIFNILYSREKFLALSMMMLFPSCLLHVILGLGLPRAVHSRVTLLPSVRTLSPLLKLSSMRGGTEKGESYNSSHNIIL